MSLEDQLDYWDLLEALRLRNYQLKEEEDFFHEVFMAVKKFRCGCRWPFHWTEKRYPASLVPAWQAVADSSFDHRFPFSSPHLIAL